MDHRNHGASDLGAPLPQIGGGTVKANSEQRTLKFSIALTVFLGVLGVASGLITNSQAIIFDGMYSFVDVVPTVVSLLVVKLIARGTSHRFQYGFWHLEPLVAVLRDAILAVACIYAAIDAMKALTSGGHEVEYGRAALWAGMLCVIGIAMSLCCCAAGPRHFNPRCSSSMRAAGR